MRCAAAALCLLVALAALCAAAAAAPAAHYGRGSRPRTIRGFKNVALSTARGFGKRDGNQLEAALADRDTTLPDSFPVEWFAAEMQNNPELARMIVSKFVDANQDGELTAEELLRPTY
ncbi:allatotropins-like [Schistocerca piceifrons]|uniref:Allatotropin isoform 2 n=3 Tax=Schistocerca TaxID=7008 RepID=A0A7D5AXK4_SCHNI|nr:allatotropins-like [Schistocerca piceifrons]XP_049779871.1 allatotropins-like [Schistocerca cancellata]XP_049808409.1 allatotropins-like [Schistocerca nitens]XP_049859774.1 allatotropins-like [Schistocerca gregaria]XP_049859775.1 allatotropins-like [Schistocerca gregaria]AKC92815.1 allatotropin precursor [Schistocerca gregaria]QKV51350.1 allatotropin [Schistocerca piceifrons]QKV51354.1 allatotropin isoform 2 [Schistocerca nitens]UGX04171.1 allatotropin [Schistocerca gregaria]